MQGFFFQYAFLLFEKLLKKYINYRNNCQKFETTKKRNKVVEYKDILISNINEYEKEFNDKQLLITLRTVMKLGRHKNKKKNNAECMKKKKKKSVK